MSTQAADKPAALTDEHLEYLDELRESGATNMFAAAPCLRMEFADLSKNDARDILLYWMHTFDKRHPQPRGGLAA